MESMEQLLPVPPLQQQQQQLQQPSSKLLLLHTLVYTVSGICQPLIMSLLKFAGLADSSCQIPMVFYYLGPCLPLLNVWGYVGGEGSSSESGSSSLDDNNNNNQINNNTRIKRKNSSGNLEDSSPRSPSRSAVWKAIWISMLDIVATVMNYTGASLAGPAIFTIIYSSVAIWAACYSRILLGRFMSHTQWIGVFVVFGGLAIAATDSVSMGEDVFHGTVLILFGSSLHGLYYVLSEAIMTKLGEDCLTASQTNYIQSLASLVCLLAWQVVYTRNQFDELVLQPMNLAGTSTAKASFFLAAFAFANLLHSYSFFFTLKFIAGGSTTVGVMKAVMAVSVFVMTALFFCRHIGGQEMCFSKAKLISLITVVTGATVFGAATRENREGGGSKEGYSRIDNEMSRIDNEKSEHGLELEVEAI